MARSNPSSVVNCRAVAFWSAATAVLLGVASLKAAIRVVRDIQPMLRLSTFK
jgi:HAMP domain-containing protein